MADCSAFATAAEHPRARGENGLDADRGAAAKGTSPRTRGKQGGHYAQASYRGNIPAHAGKTTLDLDKLNRAVEHPRARGENATIRSDLESYVGTSPRTRGKLYRALVRLEPPRNIPAHAGKTAFPSTPKG